MCGVAYVSVMLANMKKIGKYDITTWYNLNMMTVHYIRGLWPMMHISRHGALQRYAKRNFCKKYNTRYISGAIRFILIANVKKVIRFAARFALDLILLIMPCQRTLFNFRSGSNWRQSMSLGQLAMSFSGTIALSANSRVFDFPVEYYSLSKYIRISTYALN